MSLHTNGSFCTSTCVLEIMECSNSSVQTVKIVKDGCIFFLMKAPHWSDWCAWQKFYQKKKEEKKRAKVWVWCALLCEWDRAYLLCRTNHVRMGNDTWSTCVLLHWLWYENTATVKLCYSESGRLRHIFSLLPSSRYSEMTNLPRETKGNNLGTGAVDVFIINR